MTARSLRSIYQLKVTLKSIRPPIWRRFLIVSTTNLGDVHIALQIAMGWTDSHLHEFIKGDQQYGDPDKEFPSDIKNESDFRLDQVLKHEKEKLIYIYDFGDGWEHEILLEKILPFEHGMALPKCITGRRACPPEDIGGPGGYAMFLEAMTDPEHPEHKEVREWVDGDFDAAYFDIDQVNELFREYCRR